MRQPSLTPGRIVIYSCVALSILFLIQTTIVPQLNLWELDTLSFRQKMVRENRTAAAPIALVVTDDRSKAAPEMNTLFGKHPWRRDVYALVARFFMRTGAKGVLFDLSFDGGRDNARHDADLLFAESMKGSNLFASSLMFNFGQEKSMKWDELPASTQKMLAKQSVSLTGVEHRPVLKSCAANGLIPPLPDLYPVMSFYSPFCLIGDKSGVYRFWLPLTFYENVVIPNSALALATNGTSSLSLSGDGTLSWDKGKIHLGDGIPVIRWHGNQLEEPRPYPEYSIWNVVQSELVLSCHEQPGLSYCKQITLPVKAPLSPRVFDGRYVIIGETATNSFDTHQVIYEANRYPGVYIVANVLDNILHDDFVRRTPAWIEFILGLLTCAAVLWMVFRFEQINTALMGSTTLAVGYFMMTIPVYLHWNVWLNAVYPITGMITCFSGGYVYRYLKAKKAREQMRFAFGKYVSPSVMKQIENNPDAIKLGGTRQEMTMLFCDIRGFTTYSENHSPEEVQNFLTQYFSTMNNIILNRFNGTINKLIGDAIFAYWGFPLQNEEHALLAVSAALAMQEAIKEWQNDPSRPKVDIGIGIHTGEVMVGNVGSEDFMDFTLIGDAVNTASRLESLNKEMKTRIIVSGITYDRISAMVKARPLGATKIRGKENEVPIYEPLGLQF